MFGYGRDLNTYSHAEALQAQAIDSLYTRPAGHDTFHTDSLPEDIDVFRRIAEHPWGRSATLIAYNPYNEVYASATALTAGTPSITSRILSFRTAHLIWHHGDTDPMAIEYISLGRNTYQLRKTPHLDQPAEWTLRSDIAPAATFTSLGGAAAHVIDHLET